MADFEIIIPEVSHHCSGASAANVQGFRHFQDGIERDSAMSAFQQADVVPRRRTMKPTQVQHRVT
jgi:hypothetical protein